MIPADSFPMYVLFIDLDPTQVDVNVHPTKQEIKFEDEKIVYAFVQAAVKHALAQFSVTPALDFDLDSSIQQLESIQKPFTDEKKTETQSSGIFQTFTEANQAHKIEPGILKDWRDHSLSKLSQNRSNETLLQKHFIQPSPLLEVTPIQFLNTYILLPTGELFQIIHQQSAHERIIYERLLLALEGNPISTQRSLFPITLEFSPSDTLVVHELIPLLQQTGYILEHFGQNTFIIQGIPAHLSHGQEKMIIENIVERYKNFSSELKISKQEILLRTISAQQAIKPGISLSEFEMKSLVNDLFNCTQPNFTPSGRPVFIEFSKDQLDKMFGRG